MPWYDILFFLVIGGFIGSGMTYMLRPELTDRQRAYRDQRREQRQREMALTFSPGERIWFIGSMGVMAGLLLWTLS